MKTVYLSIALLLSFTYGTGSEKKRCAYNYLNAHEKSLLFRTWEDFWPKEALDNFNKNFKYLRFQFGTLAAEELRIIKNNSRQNKGSRSS